MDNPNTCQELYELLCFVEQYKLKKIPKDILDHIYHNRNINYKTSINCLDPFNAKSVSIDTFKLFFKLDYNYMMTDEEKRFIDSDTM